MYEFGLFAFIKETKKEIKFQPRSWEPPVVSSMPQRCVRTRVLEPGGVVGRGDAIDIGVSPSIFQDEIISCAGLP